MRLWLVVGTLLLVGCGDGDGPTPPEPDPKLTGEWELTGDPGFSFDLDLRETASGSSPGALGGSAVVIADSLDAVLAVTGHHDYPDVSMTFTGTGWLPFTFTGELNAAGLLVGELNGSGFEDYPVVWEQVGT